MASKAVEDAVDSYLAANWTACPIFMENSQGDAPDDGSPFLLVDFPVSNTERAAVNQRLYREEGGARVIINVPRGGGTSLIRQWGEQIAALFRDVRISGINFLVPTEPAPDDSSDQGNYFTAAVVLVFWRSFTG
jgi:hypothetical protein